MRFRRQDIDMLKGREGIEETDTEDLTRFKITKQAELSFR